MTNLLLCVVSIYLLTAAFGCAEQPMPDWVRLTEHAAFSPRDTAEGVVFAGKMWLSNGYVDGGGVVRDLWNSTDGITWTRVSDNTPYDAYAEMTVYDGKIWAVNSSVWNSTDGVNWKQIARTKPFGPRGYGEFVVHDGRMWQLGSGEDVWNTTDGVKWTCTAEHASYGERYATATSAFAGKLWVMAGATHKPNDPPEKGYPKLTTLNDVWCSADGANWTRVLERAPWAPRMWSVAIVYADRLWIIGGFDNVHGRNLDDLWWTKDGTNWQRLETKTKFTPRHEVTPYVWDNHLWVVGGNMWPLMNDVWRLTPPLVPDKQ